MDPLGPVFSALADPTRRHVLQTLAHGDPVTASGLAAELPMTRQAVAKHLVQLSQAGLVRSTRSGRETRYALEPRPLSDAAGWLAGLGAEWDERLARLERVLGERRP